MYPTLNTISRGSIQCGDRQPYLRFSQLAVNGTCGPAVQLSVQPIILLEIILPWYPDFALVYVQPQIQSQHETFLPFTSPHFSLQSFLSSHQTFPSQFHQYFLYFHRNFHPPWPLRVIYTWCFKLACHLPHHEPQGSCARCPWPWHPCSFTSLELSYKFSCHMTQCLPTCLELPCSTSHDPKGLQHFLNFYVLTFQHLLSSHAPTSHHLTGLQHLSSHLTWPQGSSTLLELFYVLTFQSRLSSHAPTSHGLKGLQCFLNFFMLSLSNTSWPLCSHFPALLLLSSAFLFPHKCLPTSYLLLCLQLPPSLDFYVATPHDYNGLQHLLSFYFPLSNTSSALCSPAMSSKISWAFMLQPHMTLRVSSHFSWASSGIPSNDFPFSSIWSDQLRTCVKGISFFSYVPWDFWIQQS